MLLVFFVDLICCLNQEKGDEDEDEDDTLSKNEEGFSIMY